MVPLLESAKVNCTDPTFVNDTPPGLNGTALKAGPVVRKSVPE